MKFCGLRKPKVIFFSITVPTWLSHDPEHRKFTLHEVFELARAERLRIGNCVGRADLADPVGYLLDFAAQGRRDRRAEDRLADFAGLRVAHAEQSGRI